MGRKIVDKIGKRVKILAIGKGCVWYKEDRKELIGKTGTLTYYNPSHSKGGFVAARIKLDEKIKKWECLNYDVMFYEVKVKYLKDKKND